MTLPVIYSVCRTNPDTHFVLITRPSLISLFINAPANLLVRGKDIAAYKGLGGARRLWKECNVEFAPGYLVCLDNMGFSRSMAFFARLNGCRVSVVTDAGNSRQLIRRNNKVMLPLMSARARYREAFFRLGLPVQHHFNGLYGTTGKGDPTLFATITAPPSGNEKWIGIAPFAKHRGKSYPPHLMEEVLSILETELEDIRIILFGGGEDEIRILTDWASRHRCAMSPVQAKLGFPAELSMLSYLDVLLTMDSANMHLASLVNVPVITVWGATHPYCGFKGWHQDDSAMISLPMPCRPCSLFGDRQCHRGDYYCLTSIKPRFIAEKVIGVLKK